LLAVLLKMDASEKGGLDKRAEIYHAPCQNRSDYFGCFVRVTCPFERISD
jgi:hypothetical protein